MLADLMHSDMRVRGVRNGSSNAFPEASSSKQHIPRQDGVVRLPTAADMFVPHLPGIPNLATHPTHPVNLYAGLIPSYPGEGKGGGEGNTGKDAKIFMMMAKARRSAGKQRLIFWFNGGPGCSSFDGALMEVGPFRTVPGSQTESGKAEVKLVEGGWEEFATVVFVDQPPGTGLSFIPTNGYLHELDQGSQHLIQFLKNFYLIFPEYDGVDTYLTGESFAGQFIPYFADALLKTPPTRHFTLTGIAIGNGWIDPKQQYPGYIDFAYEKKLLVKGTPAADQADKNLERCMETLKQYDGRTDIPINVGGGCENVMNTVTNPFTQELNGKKMCMNVYDVRKMDDWPACGMNWPPDLPDVYEFLRRDDVLRNLHAEEKSSAWIECDNKVSSELYLQSSFASVQYIPGILEKGVQVMMFAGAEDLICNSKGIERMLDNMEWLGQTGFGNITASEWYLNGTQVGEWTVDRNMTYAKLYKASHMAGFDVPHVTNDMITRFMDVDLSLVPGLLGKTSGKLGGVNKIALSVGSAGAAGIPLLKGGKSDVENWYNIASAFLILFILLSIVGLYFYFKRRRTLGRRSMVSSRLSDEAERVPLGSERVEMDDIERAEGYELDERGKKYRPRSGSRKGKERAIEDDDHERDGQTVFALGDDDDGR